MDLIKPKIIETDRLILRLFEFTDAPDMYNNWGSDDEVSKWLQCNNLKSVKESEALINCYIQFENSAVRTSYRWAIYSKEYNTLIGKITTNEINDKNEYCDIGYCLGSKWWGKGYASEALLAVLKFLLEEVKFNLVTASCDVANQRSIRVLEKIGMKYEATLRSRCKRKDGTFADMNVYSIKKEELL